jgi:rhodanese-related sulfurtransferase
MEPASASGPLEQWRDSRQPLLDVRSPSDFAASHLIGATGICWDALPQRGAHRLQHPATRAISSNNSSSLCANSIGIATKGPLNRRHQKS